MRTNDTKGMPTVIPNHPQWRSWAISGSIFEIWEAFENTVFWKIFDRQQICKNLQFSSRRRLAKRLKRRSASC